MDALLQLLIAAGRQVQGLRQLFLGKAIVQPELPHLADPKGEEVLLVPSQRQDPLPQQRVSLRTGRFYQLYHPRATSYKTCGTGFV